MYGTLINNVGNGYLGGLGRLNYAYGLDSCIFNRCSTPCPGKNI